MKNLDDAYKKRLRGIIHLNGMKLLVQDPAIVLEHQVH